MSILSVRARRAAMTMTAIMTTAFVPAAHAQTTSPIGRGSWIVDGTAGFSRFRNETQDFTTTSFHLAPTGLRFIAPRFAVGGTVSLGYATTGGETSKSYGVGPSARYYFGDPAGSLFPFLGASVFPQWQKVHPQSSVNEFTNRITTIDVSAGLTQMVATHVGLEGAAYYTHFDVHNDAGGSRTTVKEHDIGVRFGITAFVF